MTTAPSSALWAHDEPAWPVSDLAAYLVGRWRLHRVILDRGGAPRGAFTGHGRFTPAEGDPGRLDYLERGRLRFDGHEGPATRRLRYDCHGPRAQVRFEDGRAFHGLDLRTGADEAVHPCGPDHYRGRFVVLGEATWQHRWTVSGPHKDATIITALSRPAPAEQDGRRAAL